MVKCQHACPVHTERMRLCDRHRRRPLRRRVPHRARHQSVRVDLRAGLRCSLRSQLPPRRRGRADFDSRPEAFRDRQVWSRSGRLQQSITKAATSACCRRIAATTRKSRWSAAGVSGLTVAHDLAQIGYKVTVFEANSEPGGMLTVGVPVFRLPRELVKSGDQRHSCRWASN